MERSLKILLMLFVSLLLISPLTLIAPLFGLSTSLGVSVLGSSVLGSSVLGSSVLASTVIVEAYNGAILTSQLWLSLSAIGMLVYLEVSDPTYGKLRTGFAELRKSWLPASTLLILLFFIIFALKVCSIIGS